MKFVSLTIALFCIVGAAVADDSKYNIEVKDSWKVMQASMAHCPHACPGNTIAQVQKNCIPSCKEGENLNLRGPRCGACIAEHISRECRDCFGEFMRANNLIDQGLTQISMNHTNQLIPVCLKKCIPSGDCPADTQATMKSQCKDVCKNEKGFVAYGAECDECIKSKLGYKCYSCFGKCFRDDNVMDPRTTPITKEESHELVDSCIAQCPQACPTDTKRLMYESCRFDCRKGDGFDLNQPSCKTCVISTVGLQCYHCFGYCFRDAAYNDQYLQEPRTPEQSAAFVASTAQFCKDFCPNNLFPLMHDNCQDSCNLNGKVMLSTPACDECVINTLGRSCWTCFGRHMYPEKHVLDPKEAFGVVGKCIQTCPVACGKDTISNINGNCKSVCRTEKGVELYDPACEKCVIEQAGESCYMCVGVCLRDSGVHDPRPMSKSRLAPSTVRPLVEKCLGTCSAECPADSLQLMARNCKSICRKENGIDLYEAECEECQIATLGRACYDCFGVCMPENGYPDPRITVNAQVISREQAIEHVTRCYGECPMCPSDYRQIMLNNCKSKCNTGRGINLVDKACSDCAEEFLGAACNDCFEVCLRKNWYFSPPSVPISHIPVERAQPLVNKCAGACPNKCPADIHKLMRMNCVLSCKSDNGVNMYESQCEDCVRKTLGDDCYDCFGECFRKEGYLDPRLPLNENIPLMSPAATKKMVGALYEECTQVCPSDLFVLMKENCKSTCRKGDVVDIYSKECDKCVIKTLGQTCYDCFGDHLYSGKKDYWSRFQEEEKLQQKEEL